MGLAARCLSAATAAMAATPPLAAYLPPALAIDTSEPNGEAW